MSEKKPDELRISNVPPFGLRMLPDLRARIEHAAAESGRSLNAEIIARLEASFDPAKEPILEQHRQLEQRIQALEIAILKPKADE